MRGKRSVSRKAVAPGVISMATTSSAPTACSAATAVSDSRPSSSRCSRPVGRPMARACWASKQYSSRSFHFTATTSRQPAPTAKSCHRSASAMPSRLPNRIVVSRRLLGYSEISSRPRAKKAVKTTPITASLRSLVARSIAPMPSTANRPDSTAPSRKGAPAR